MYRGHRGNQERAPPTAPRPACGPLPPLPIGELALLPTLPRLVSLAHPPPTQALHALELTFLDTIVISLWGCQSQQPRNTDRRFPHLGKTTNTHRSPDSTSARGSHFLLCSLSRKLLERGVCLQFFLTAPVCSVRQTPMATWCVGTARPTVPSLLPPWFSSRLRPLCSPSVGTLTQATAFQLLNL